MTKLKLLLVTTLVLLLLPLSSTQAQSVRYLPDVSDLVVTAGSEAVTLTWKKVAGADSYTIYYGPDSVATDGGIYAESIVTDNITQYEVTGLKAEQTYYFAVAAEDSTGTMLGSPNYSKEVTVVPLVVDVSGLVADPTSTSDPVVDSTTSNLTDSTPREAAPAKPNLAESGPVETLAMTTLVALLGAYLWRRRSVASQL